MAEINNTPAHEHDIAITCAKRGCEWKGMESDLRPGGRVKGIRGAIQRVCPQCGCDSYYKRLARVPGDVK